MPEVVSPTLRRVYVAQTVGSLIDGIALSTAVLYFHAHVGLSAQTVGFVLSGASICALVLIVPLGVVADRIGLRTAAVTFSLVAAAALATYAVAEATWSYAAGAVLFMVSQAGIGAVRQAIVTTQIDAAGRVRARAVLHTLLNVGLGAGTVVGTVVAAFGDSTPFVVAFTIGAAAAVGCSLIFAGLPRVDAGLRPVRPVGAPRFEALRDRAFVRVSTLAGLLQLTMPALSILLPLWVIEFTEAPAWVAAAALGLNTVLVLLTQTAWAGRIRSDADAARSTAIGAVGLLSGCVLIGLASEGSSTSAVVIIVAGVVLLTVGEVTGGAGTWHLAFSKMPSTSPAQYQAVFGMSASAARVLGPLLVLPMMLAIESAGWVVLGAVMAAAALALTAIGVTPGSLATRAAAPSPRE